MKCPYCHIDFNSQAGYEAHVKNCMYKDNPLPEPEPKEEISLEDMTAKEIISESTGIKEIDELKSWLEKEKEGEERKTVIEAIEDRIQVLKEE